MWKFIKRILAAANETSFRSTVAGVGGMIGGTLMCLGGKVAEGGSLIALGAGLIASADNAQVKRAVEKMTKEPTDAIH